MTVGGKIIPDNIQELSMCEIFVFGSNLAGQHHGGAARVAYDKFGAEWSVGVGRTGQTYAIPTMHGGVEDIKPYVDDFIEYAKCHPNNRFLVTRIGCGIAGFKDKEIAPLFQEAWELPNVKFPRQWLPILTHDKFIDAVMFGIIPKEEVVEIPRVITENELIRLSEKYRYIIGSGVKAPLPKIKIRYVIDKDKFGYADFGDFIMIETGDLYVWTQKKEFAEDHNQDMVEVFFEDECKGRGYLCRFLFAGVETPYRDSNGESIFTGDVLHLTGKYLDYTFALGTLGENSDDREAQYAFVLDNHCVTIDMCNTMTRVGTVFYQLDWNDPQSIPDLCYRFQPAYPDQYTEEDRILMAKYTPNFDKEFWKYQGLDILGVEEYNWRR